MKKEIYIGNDLPKEYREFLYNREESSYVKITGGYYGSDEVDKSIVKKNKWKSERFTICTSKQIFRRDVCFGPDGHSMDIYEYKILKKPLRVEIRLLENCGFQCGSTPMHYVVDGVPYRAHDDLYALFLEEDIKWHRVDSKLKEILILYRHVTR